MIASLSAAVGRLPDESRGALGMLVAHFFFVSMDAMAKHLTETVPPLEVVWARYTGQTIFLLVLFAPRLRTTLRTANLKLQVVRSALLFTVTILYFTSLSVLGLAEAASLMQLSPLLIVAMAALVLAEKVGPRRWFGVALGLVGALVILKPGLGVFQPAALLTLAAALCLAAYQVATRMLGGQDSIWTTMLYTTGLGSIIATLGLPFFWETPPWEAVPAMVVIGVIGFVGHLALVWSLAQAPASVLAPFNYLGLVWAMVFGLAVFGEIPDLTTLAGAAIIVGAGLYVWHRERARKAAGG